MRGSEEIRDIIKLWPSPAVNTLANDMNEKPGTVRKWHDRGNIPCEYWNGLRRAGAKRGIAISLDFLAEIAEKADG